MSRSSLPRGARTPRLAALATIALASACAPPAPRAASPRATAAPPPAAAPAPGTPSPCDPIDRARCPAAPELEVCVTGAPGVAGSVELRTPRGTSPSLTWRDRADAVAAAYVASCAAAPVVHVVLVDGADAATATHWVVELEVAPDRIVELNRFPDSGD